MKNMLYLLLCVCLLAAPACSSKKDDPAAVPSQPELAVASGQVVAYLDGVATTFTGARNSTENDANETRYYVSQITSGKLTFALKFVLPPNQALPSAKEQDLILLTQGTATTPSVSGTGRGALTVVRSTTQAGYSFTGSFNGTLDGHKLEGGKFKDILY